MRYSVATALAPQTAIAYAKDYFGPQGVGLEVIDDHETCVTLQGRVLLWCGRLQAVIEDHETCVTLQGGGGHIAVVACAGAQQTTLELETRAWDDPVQQFIREVSERRVNTARHNVHRRDIALQRRGRQRP